MHITCGYYKFISRRCLVRSANCRPLAPLHHRGGGGPERFRFPRGSTYSHQRRSTRTAHLWSWPLVVVLKSPRGGGVKEGDEEGHRKRKNGDNQKFPEQNRDVKRGNEWSVKRSSG